MLKHLCILVVFIYSYTTGRAQRDTLENSVVYIETKLWDPEGQNEFESETGAGIIVGHGSFKDSNEDVLYVLSALHVVAPEMYMKGDRRSIKVRFRNSSRFHPAEIVSTRKNMDLVLLAVNNGYLDRLPRLRIGFKNSIDQDDKVIAIGHPSGSRWDNFSTSIRSLDNRSPVFRVMADGISGGSSGGAIFSYDTHEWIGMIVEENPVGAYCLYSETIVNILKEQGRTINLIDAKRKKVPTEYELDLRGKDEVIDNYNPEVKRRIVYLESHELNLERELMNPYMNQAIKSSLSKYGYMFTQDEEDASFIIRIVGQTRKGDNYKGLFFSYAEGNLQIIDPNTGLEIINKDYNGFKGGGKNYETAGEAALKKMAKFAAEDILNKIDMN